MNSPLPDDHPLKDPNRIEVLDNGAEPLPYTVKVYRDGQVIDTKHFSSEIEAKAHQAVENDRIDNASGS